MSGRESNEKNFYFTALGLLVSTAFNVNGADWPNYGMGWPYNEMNGYGDGTGEFGEPPIKSIRTDGYAAHPYMPQHINGFTAEQTLQPANGYSTMQQQPGFLPADFSVPNTISPETVQGMQYVIAPADLAYNTQPATSAATVSTASRAQPVLSTATPPTTSSTQPVTSAATASATLQRRPIPAELVHLLRNLNENNPVVIDGNTAYICAYPKVTEECIRSLHSINSSEIVKCSVVYEAATGEKYISNDLGIYSFPTKTRSFVTFPGSDGTYRLDSELNLELIFYYGTPEVFFRDLQTDISIIEKILDKVPLVHCPEKFAHIDTPTIDEDRLYLPYLLGIQHKDALLKCLRLNIIHEIYVLTPLGNCLFINGMHGLESRKYLRSFLYKNQVPIILLISLFAKRVEKGRNLNVTLHGFTMILDRLLISANGNI